MLRQFALTIIIFIVLYKFCGRTIGIAWDALAITNISNFRGYLNEVSKPHGGEDVALPPSVITALEGLRELHAASYRIHESFLYDEYHPQNEQYQRLVEGAWPIRILEADPPFENIPDKDFFALYQPLISPIHVASYVVSRIGFLQQDPKCRLVWSKDEVEIGFCDI